MYDLPLPLTLPKTFIFLRCLYFEEYIKNGIKWNIFLTVFWVFFFNQRISIFITNTWDWPTSATFYMFLFLTFYYFCYSLPTTILFASLFSLSLASQMYLPPSYHSYKIDVIEHLTLLFSYKYYIRENL